MEKLLLICDLGRVRAVHFREPGGLPLEQPHFHEEEGDTWEFRPDRITEATSDQAGRFTQSGPLGRGAGMSFGEEHHLTDELHRKALLRIAARVTAVVEEADYPPCRLVAPERVLPRLLELLPPAVAACVAATEEADLTKMSLRDLEHRFLAAR